MVQPDQVFEYVEVTQAALTKAASDLSQRAQADESAAARIPAILDGLQASGLLQPNHVKRASQALLSHAGALDALQELAAKAVLRSSVEAPESIGTPIAPGGTKTASAAKTENASRYTSPADHLFLEKMASRRNERI